MSEIYWAKNIVSNKVLQGEMTFSGVFGESLDKDYKSMVEDMLERKRIKNMMFYVKNNDKKDLYRVVNPVGDVAKTMSQCINDTMISRKDLQGVVIEDNLESFTEWKDKRRWMRNFSLQFSQRFYQIRGKQPAIYSTAMDIDSLKGLLEMVDGILVLPLNGLLYGDNRFLLPSNGYLRLEDESYRDSYRQTFSELAQLLHIKQAPGETYLDFITRMQVHVFNFEIKRLTWDYDTQGDFKYGEDKVDMDRMYDLALVRGMQENRSMRNIIEDMRQGINKAMVQGDSTEMMSSMARIYAILLSRIEVGTGMDEKNGDLSSVVSKDIKNALHYGLKIQERIQDIEDSEHKRELDTAKIRLEREKFELQKHGSVPYDGELDAKKLDKLEERLNNEDQEGD